MDWEQLVGSDEPRHAFVEHFEPLVSSDDGREALQALAERVHRFGITPASSPRTEEFDDDPLAKKPLGAELSESYVDGAPKRFLLVEFTDPFGDPVARWLCWPPAAELPSDIDPRWARACSLHGQIRSKMVDYAFLVSMHPFHAGSDYVIQEPYLSHGRIGGMYEPVLTYDATDYYLIRDASGPGLGVRGPDESQPTVLPRSRGLSVGDAFLCFTGLGIAIDFDREQDPSGLYSWFTR